MWNLSELQHNEMKSYFKSEYKTDWEYQYVNFLENRKSASMLKKKINSILQSLFPNSSEMKELEKDMDRRKSQENDRYKRLGIAS